MVHQGFLVGVHMDAHVEFYSKAFVLQQVIPVVIDFYPFSVSANYLIVKQF
jgi:hypothetical protein